MTVNNEILTWNQQKDFGAIKYCEFELKCKPFTQLEKIFVPLFCKNMLPEFYYGF